MKYSYQAKNMQGITIKGVVEAESENQAADILANNHLIPFKIQLTKASTLQEFMTFYFHFGMPGTEDLMMFCRQMYSLTKAGVPLVRAVRVVMKSSKNKLLKESLDSIVTEVESGQTISAAMKKHPLVFPNLIISLVSVGENTGSLDEVFRQLAIHFEREADTRRKIKSATRYPIMVLVVIAVAVGVINIVVIPAFSSFFQQFKATLPLPTRILIATSNFTVEYWYLVILGLLGTFVAMVYAVNTPQGERVYDTYVLSFPILGSIIKRSLLARFARMFSLCVRTGIPLLNAIQLIADATDNVYVCDRIMTIRIDIEKGESLTTSANKTGLFTELVLQMMLIGEETGELDKLFDEVGRFYEEQVDYDIQRLGSAIEPILIACIGGIVLVLALGVFLPMWNISQTAMAH